MASLVIEYLCYILYLYIYILWVCDQWFIKDDNSDEHSFILEIAYLYNHACENMLTIVINVDDHVNVQYIWLRFYGTCNTPWHQPLNKQKVAVYPGVNHHGIKMDQVQQ